MEQREDTDTEAGQRSKGISSIRPHFLSLWESNTTEPGS